MAYEIRTEQDERNQHAVVIAKDGQERIYSRNSSAHVISATYSALQKDLAQHGDDAVDFDSLPVAEFRVTKAQKRLLMAA